MITDTLKHGFRLLALFMGLNAFLTAPLTAQNKVGVNTTIPVAEIDVRSLTADDGADINIGNLTNSHFLRLFSGKETTIFSNPTIYWSEGDSLVFGSFGGSFTENMRISANGWVGIGTPKPLTELHVKDDQGWAHLTIQSHPTGDATLLLTDANAASPLDHWSIARDGSDVGKLKWRHDNDTKMTLRTGGWLGIGTDHPLTELHVRDDVGWANLLVESPDGANSSLLLADDTAADVYGHWAITRDGSDAGKLKWRHDNDTKMTLRTGGWLGIGTDHPLTELHVRDAAGWANLLIESPDGASSSLLLADDTAADVFDHWAITRDGNDGGKLQWRHDNAARMTLRPDGRLGVGTTSPSVEFHVKDEGFGAWTRITAESGLSGDAIIQLTEDVSQGLDHDWTLRRDGNDGGKLQWRHDNNIRAYMTTAGDMVLGNIAPASGYRFSVDGNIMAEEVRVQLSSDWPDYVFEEDYKLPSLHDVQMHIDSYGHLPGIPSAQEVEEDGHHLGVTQLKLLEKIEELTLYILDLNAHVTNLEQEIQQLKAKTVSAQ